MTDADRSPEPARRLARHASAATIDDLLGLAPIDSDPVDALVQSISLSLGALRGKHPAVPEGAAILVSIVEKKETGTASHLGLVTDERVLSKVAVIASLLDSLTGAANDAMKPENER